MLYALLLHVGLLLTMWLGLLWTEASRPVSVAGPVIEAALVISAADIRASEAAMRDAPKPAEPAPEQASPPPQPQPEPRPQTADEQPQPSPQAPQPEPATVDQEAVARLALEQEQAREREEQEERRRQEQIDLTERERQQEVERRQRLREQYEAIRREREAAERRTRMEEQRLRQLADRADTAAPNPAPQREASVAAGNNGTDTDLQARYAMAMNQTARSNWNTALAPELMRCQVSFTQIPGGEVIDVRFMMCGYDEQGRESVERALRKTPMPYAGFESVFQRQVTLTFCHPEEACNR